MTLDGAFAQRETRHAARSKEGQSGLVYPRHASTAKSLTPRANRSQCEGPHFRRGPETGRLPADVLEGHFLPSFRRWPRVPIGKPVARICEAGSRAA